MDERLRNLDIGYGYTADGGKNLPFSWQDAIANGVEWCIAERPGNQAWSGLNAFSLHIITQNRYGIVMKIY